VENKKKRKKKNDYQIPVVRRGVAGYRRRDEMARDASMELVGVHGSMSAEESNVFSPVWTITKAVGRTLTL